MPQDNLSHALVHARDRKRAASARSPKRPTGSKPRRGRPRAFDPFHNLSVILLAAGLALQIFAVLYYS